MTQLLFLLQDELSKLPVIDGAIYEAGVKLKSYSGRSFFVFQISARWRGKPALMLEYRAMPKDAFRDLEQYPYANHFRHLVTQMTDDIRNKWGVK